MIFMKARVTVYVTRVTVYVTQIKGIFDIPIYTSKEIQEVTSSIKGYDPLHMLSFQWEEALIKKRDQNQ